MTKMAGLQPDIGLGERPAIVFFQIAGAAVKIKDFTIDVDLTIDAMGEVDHRMVALHAWYKLEGAHDARRMPADWKLPDLGKPELACDTARGMMNVQCQAFALEKAGVDLDDQLVTRGQKRLERIVEVPGLAGFGVDDLDESVALAIWINRHAWNQGYCVMTVLADALEIPALEITLGVVLILEISWMTHHFPPGLARLSFYIDIALQVVFRYNENAFYTFQCNRSSHLMQHRAGKKI